MEKITVIQMGLLARQALESNLEGTIMGTTSRGMFLKAGSRIIFITDAAYRSPFNIQIQALNGIENRFQPGDPWHFENEAVLLQNGSWRLDLNGAPVWQPTNPPPMNLLFMDGKHRLEALFEIMTRMDPSKGWLFLRQADHAGMDEEMVWVTKRVQGYMNAVTDSDEAAALENARSIMGRGGGLTPSGDDWLSGFILFFARLNRSTPFLKGLGSALVKMAYERTTLISANRLEAAFMGWAEELFLEFCDHLIDQASLFPVEKVAHLVNFGHSSGVDTCLGVEAAYYFSMNRT